MHLLPLEANSTDADLSSFFQSIIAFEELWNSELNYKANDKTISFLPKSLDISILSKSSFISLYFYSISATSSHANSLSCSLLLILKTEIAVGNTVGMRSQHLQKERAETRKNQQWALFLLSYTNLYLPWANYRNNVFWVLQNCMAKRTTDKRSCCFSEFCWYLSYIRKAWLLSDVSRSPREIRQPPYTRLFI